MTLLQNINRGYAYIHNFGLSAYIGKKRTRKDKSRYIPFVQKTLERLMAPEISALVRECDSARMKPVEKSQLRIFVFWWQGEDQMPEIVWKCVESIRRAAEGSEWKVCLITQDNYAGLVDIDPAIERLRERGKITLTHFSDILRVNLLEKYGGAWLDATIFLTDSFRNHPEILQRTLMSIRTKESTETRKYVPNGKWAVYCWFVTVTHHPLFQFAKAFLNAYLNRYDTMLDYFLLDHIVQIAYERIPAVREDIDRIPLNNPDMNYLQEHINVAWTEKEKGKWEAVKQETWIFKLSWKKKINEAPATYYSEIIQ